MILWLRAHIDERFLHSVRGQNPVSDRPGGHTGHYISLGTLPDGGLGKPAGDLGAQLRIGKYPAVVAINR